MYLFVRASLLSGDILVFALLVSEHSRRRKSSLETREWFPLVAPWVWGHALNSCGRQSASSLCLLLNVARWLLPHSSRLLLLDEYLTASSRYAHTVGTYSTLQAWSLRSAILFSLLDGDLVYPPPSLLMALLTISASLA